MTEVPRNEVQPNFRPLRLLQFVHDLPLGGVQVTVSQYLYDFRTLGQTPAVAAVKGGWMADRLRAAGIPVYLMEEESELGPVAVTFQADVIHGHTCGGGSHAVTVANGLGIVGGETVHSMVPRTTPMAGQFEICQVEGLHRMRPGSTFIRWCFDPERLTVTEGRAAVRRRLEIPLEAFVIGRNGRLDGAKDPQAFVRVLAALPKDVFGLLSGWGPEAAALQGLAVELGCLERLRMPGLCERPGNILNAMDCIVYPTVDESLCAGIVEPMLLAKPVICTPVGNMGEFLKDGTTGLGVSRQHPNGIPYMAELVKNVRRFPAAAQKMGENAKAHIESLGMHDSMNSARPLLGLYQALVAAQGRA